MPTQCTAEQLTFSWAGRRRVVAAFDGGTVSSDGGALLLGKADAAVGLIDRLSRCFIDERQADLVEHSLRTLVGQRVFALALGYEDLNDHDELRHDPVMGALLGKLSPRLREDRAALAGKSTLSRLECYPASGAHRYHKIRPDESAIERLFVALFLEAYLRAAGGDRAGSGCDRRGVARPSGSTVLSRLLRSLLLPAVVHLLRRASVGREAAFPANIDGAARAVEEVERIVAQVRAVAEDAHRVVSGLGLLPRGVDGLVRGNGVEYVSGWKAGARLVRAIGSELQTVAETSAATQSLAQAVSASLRIGRARAGAGHAVWWPRLSIPVTNRIRASS